MARESKKARDERRFGRPETLADTIIGTPASSWIVPVPYREAAHLIEGFRSKIADCPVIVATNVSDYFFDHDQDWWEYETDFPEMAPPFGSFFIEARSPRVVRSQGQLSAPDPAFPRRFGMLFEVVEPAGKLYPKPDGVNSTSYRMVEIPGAKWYWQASPLFVAQDGRPVFTSCCKYFATNSRGVIIESPSFRTGGVSYSQEQLTKLSDQIALILMPLLLSISFMNCRNTSTEVAEPDQQVNRERRRAGLKPFVRYHTINIEPMKRVLKSKGNIETEGLKRALHICRGHFAHYTDDRPLFGRKGATGTFWVPAHVRGSANQGIVVSDYNVRGPKDEPAPTT